MEKGKTFDRVKRCVEKVDSPQEKKQCDSNFDFLPIYVQIKARYPSKTEIKTDHSDVDDIHRVHFINVFINVFHNESVDRDFGAPS